MTLESVNVYHYSGHIPCGKCIAENWITMFEDDMLGRAFFRARELSGKYACAVLAFGYYDDDYICMSLYENGNEVIKYDSRYTQECSNIREFTRIFGYEEHEIQRFDKIVKNTREVDVLSSLLEEYFGAPLLVDDYVAYQNDQNLVKRRGRELYDEFFSKRKTVNSRKKRQMNELREVGCFPGKATWDVNGNLLTMAYLNEDGVYDWDFAVPSEICYDSVCTAIDVKCHAETAHHRFNDFVVLCSYNIEADKTNVTIYRDFVKVGEYDILGKVYDFIDPQIIISCKYNFESYSCVLNGLSFFGMKAWELNVQDAGEITTQYKDDLLWIFALGAEFDRLVVMGVDAKDGTIVCEKCFDDVEQYQVDIVGDHLYMYLSGEKNRIVIENNRLETVREINLSIEDIWVNMKVSQVSERVYGISLDGNLQCINLVNGRRDEARIKGSILLVEIDRFGNVVICDESNYVYIFDSELKCIMKKHIEGYAFAIMSTNNTLIFALDSEYGPEVWGMKENCCVRVYSVDYLEE